jgi:outer membrane receptor for ferrienterochelin and colicins
MIDRMEIIRGGGSALYGSNAIAGTINLILKDPISNSYELDISSSAIGVGHNNGDEIGEDHTAKFNTSLVSSDSKTGMALYGFYRNRNPFDANKDGFSELSSIENSTIGGRMFHRFTNRNRISLDVFSIKEDRRGGDRHDYPLHEANIAEAVNHKITTGALNYDQLLREHDKWSIYASGQKVDRDSYYGAGQSLKDYGNTQDFSYVMGTQYHYHLNKSEITVGAESQGAQMKDKKLGYPDIENAEITISGTDTTLFVPHTSNVTVADQQSQTHSIFAQYQYHVNRFKATLGGRFDSYKITDDEAGTEKTGNVISPRVTLLYDIAEFVQARVSYAQGYRAPQIFDEDLHIETSEARKVLHENDPDLTQETSHSLMGSLDFNKKLGNIYFGLLAEGFYTRLEDAFANEYSEPDENGVVTYTRVNAEGGATVTGVNVEVNIVPHSTVAFKTGFTYQISQYDKEQEFGEKSFFRTPDDYGFATLSWNPTKRFGASATGNYTGKMLVPYFGETIADPEAGELRQSDPFIDLGMKVQYNTKLNGATLQVYAGLKNMFNSYQDDFDSGENRDPGYIYGPAQPRTVYLGVKIGNLIK